MLHHHKWKQLTKRQREVYRFVHSSAEIWFIDLASARDHMRARRGARLHVILVESEVPALRCIKVGVMPSRPEHIQAEAA